MDTLKCSLCASACARVKLFHFSAIFNLPHDVQLAHIGDISPNHSCLCVFFSFLDPCFFFPGPFDDPVAVAVVVSSSANTLMLCDYVKSWKIHNSSAWHSSHVPASLAPLRTRRRTDHTSLCSSSCSGRGPASLATITGYVETQMSSDFPLEFFLTIYPSKERKH